MSELRLSDVPAEQLAIVLRMAKEVSEDLIYEVEERLIGDDPATVRRRNRDTKPAKDLLYEINDFVSRVDYLKDELPNEPDPGNPETGIRSTGLAF